MWIVGIALEADFLALTKTWNNKKMQALHVFIIASAICNLVYFVEGRPTEFDFNSNVINVINRSQTSNAGN